MCVTGSSRRCGRATLRADTALPLVSSPAWSESTCRSPRSRASRSAATSSPASDASSRSTRSSCISRRRASLSRQARSRSIRSVSRALALDAALKLALVALLVVAVARQDLPQFHGKSMTGRAVGYPLAALVVPVTWSLLSRRRPRRYPFAVDILVVLPFVIDMAGNAANLYDTVSWWDDANHFVN